VLGDQIPAAEAGAESATAAVGRSWQERRLVLRAALDELRRRVRVHRMRGALQTTSLCRMAVTAAEAATLERQRRALLAADVPARRLDGSELVMRFGVRGYRAGLELPDGALAQPAALLRGLADALPLHARLFEETPVVALNREPGGWRLECSDGSVLAQRVLLTAGAGTGELGLGLRSRVARRCGWLGLTAPLGKKARARLGAQPSWGLLPVAPTGALLRRTADGRLLVGTGWGHAAGDDGDPAARLREVLSRCFPKLNLARKAAPFEHVWQGTFAATADHAPLWGAVAPEVWVAVGGADGALGAMARGGLLAQRSLGRPVPDVAALFGCPGRLAGDRLSRLGALLRLRRGRHSKKVAER
jgi:glycine/D-amino acid oxidase-like deaminating enzyme